MKNASPCRGEAGNRSAKKLMQHHLQPAAIPVKAAPFAATLAMLLAAPSVAADGDVGDGVRHLLGLVERSHVYVGADPVPATSTRPGEPGSLCWSAQGNASVDLSSERCWTAERSNLAPPFDQGPFPPSDVVVGAWVLDREVCMMVGRDGSVQPCTTLCPYIEGPLLHCEAREEAATLP